jgi:hypothetical protein
MTAPMPSLSLTARWTADSLLRDTALPDAPLAMPVQDMSPVPLLPQGWLAALIGGVLGGVGLRQGVRS